MKSKVKFSNGSIILSIITVVALSGALYLLRVSPSAFSILLALSAFLLLMALFYAPLSVSVNDNRVAVRSLLNIHKFPIGKITSVERFQPTMGAVRILGSGGFLGYWGIFREGDIGNYTAYYGKASDCFLIRLDNGNKYVLGCSNPERIIEAIRKRIANKT